MAELATSEGAGLACQFLSVPADVVIKICLYLTPKQTIRLALACRSLYKLVTTSHRLWKVFCRKVWLHSEISPLEDSWYLEFVAWCRNWGPYQDVYAEIKEAWDLVSLKLQQSGQNPDLIFHPGANESLLRAAEDRMGVSLPQDYKCFLRIHNGQLQPPPGMPHSFFCTKLHFYHYEDKDSLLAPVDKLKLWTEKFVSLSQQGTLQSYTICVKSDAEFKFGSVQCLSKFDRCMDSGKLLINVHTLASSFKEWFSRFASDMQRFPLVKGVLQRYPYLPECVATTRGITIRVGTAFSNIHSRLIPFYLVIYHITISMSESENPALSSQLTTRHWIITDDQGVQDTVHGEGVVGHTPEISPGTVFTYTSGSHVEGNWSLMEGYFTFRNLLTGETFDAKVPQFRLEVPPYSIYTYLPSEQ